MFFVGILLCCGLSIQAQTNRKIKDLQNQKKEIQRGLDQSRKELKTTERTVVTKMKDVSMLADQVENRQRYIDTMELQLKKVGRQVTSLEEKVARTSHDLEKKKADYVKALRYAYAYKSVNSPLLFILSTESVTQMYRRSRYAREYASYQRSLAENIVDQQNELLEQKNKLLGVKSEKNRLLNECMRQKNLLQKQHDEEQKNVNGLKVKQKTLQQEVEKQRQQLSQLDKKIDAMIAFEVEQARKRAEAARKKAEAEARRQEEKRRQQARNSASSSGKNTEKEQKTSIPQEYKWMTPQDKALDGDFTRNKGRLPVPITGSYMVGSHFGTYNVPGLKNVLLDNKGTNYIGRSGAMARSIFDGEVTAIFQFGDTKNVLVRHGSYISVYCNLSSVRVAKGQKVKTRDILGTVESDGNGNCVLHFQLRKETQKLNPEAWIGR